jgi:hypothetical protein
MNAARAVLLREQGLRWDEIGRIMAMEDGRAIAYQGKSVLIAVSRWRKERVETCGAID